MGLGGGGKKEKTWNNCNSINDFLKNETKNKSRLKTKKVLNLKIIRLYGKSWFKKFASTQMQRKKTDKQCEPERDQQVREATIQTVPFQSSRSSRFQAPPRL